MNASPILTQMASSLLTQLPILLVYIAGIVVCAALWGRAPNAALAAIVGLSLMLVTTIASSFFTSWAMQQRVTGNTTPSTYFMIVALGSAIFRGAGLALVLAGVFIGRPKVDSWQGFEVTPGR